MAGFADVVGARSAIEGLLDAGIDGDDIRLLSPSPPRRPTSAATRVIDRRITRALAGRVAGGVVTGAIGGLLVGALAGAGLIAATNPASSIGELVALALVGLVLGATVGAFIGFERAGTLSDAWQLTFEELRADAVWIIVTVRDQRTEAHVLRALEKHDPLEVQSSMRSSGR